MHDVANPSPERGERVVTISYSIMSLRTSMPDWLAARFSGVGLIAVVLQQLPGIIWAVHPPKVDPFAQNSGPAVVEVFEKTFGIGTVVLLVIVFTRRPVPPTAVTVFATGAFVVLALYYGFYVAYYLGVTILPVLLGMAAFPPLAFLLIALSQGNAPATVTSIVFGTVHVGLTYVNMAGPRPSP
jgi:hypothetical protein